MYDTSLRPTSFDLADSFQERQAFDVADSTADFGDDDVRIVIVADAVDAVLDFIAMCGMTWTVWPK